MLEFRAATRYAKSLLSLAEEQGVLDEVNKDMLLFTKTCEENREFSLVLKNPIIKHDKKLNILEAIFGDKMNKLSLAILTLSTKKNREAILPAIAKQFHIQYNVFKGIEDAVIKTSIPLTDSLRNEFETIVKNISGKKEVEMEEIIDETLIGGYILKVGDKQIDSSVSGKLKRIRKDITINKYIKGF